MRSATFLRCLTSLAVVLATPLPNCSTNSVTPCSCPSGTQYQQEVTFGVIGASASDVQAVTLDFFNTAWLGTSPISTTGKDNELGCVRHIPIPTSEGTIVFHEQLVNLAIESDGSFSEKFIMARNTVPVEYASGNGSFSGYWLTLAAAKIFKYETAITWSAYGCFTGHPIDFATFREGALENVTSILRNASQLHGTNMKPRSIQAWK